MLFCTSAISAGDPVFSRSKKFKIPFQFDQTELKKLGATGIQLFVSEDQGTSWKHHDSVKPEAGTFLYQSSNDGEFWFSVRTLAAGGLTYPAGEHQPDLKVIVDTSRPELKLAVTEIEPGKIELAWQAGDGHLQVDSLKLEFLDPMTNQWERVTVRSAPSGRTAWNVPQAGLVEVRGSIGDLAGNLAESMSQTIVSGSLPPTPMREEKARPIASETGSKPQMLANQPIDVQILIEPKQLNPLLVSKQSTDLILPESLAIPNAKPEPIPDESEAAINTPETQTKPVVPQFAPVEAVVPERTFAPQSLSELVPTRRLIIDIPQLKEVPSQESAHLFKPIPQAERNSPGSIPQDPQPLKPIEPKPEPVLQNEPNPPRIGHLVNSKTFRIAYELEGVGPSGVSTIELFITENGGASWFHYGSDPDRTSPIVVTVPQDGDYGFVFRIRNGIGLIATPPQPGDRPEILVTVDQTPPVVQLLPLQRRPEFQANQVLIAWTAEDRELAQNPIALYYSSQATGPWELIEGWRAHTGSLEWTVPASVEKNFYVRIDVRDAAGNITRNDGENPFTVDNARPKARITDIESLKVR